MPRRWRRATRRSSVLDGLTVDRAAGARGVGAAQRRAARTPDALTLRAALLESNNRAAALLQQRIGSRPVLRLASDVGLHDLPDVPSLALGTGLVTPLDLTAAYAVFPNGGLRRPAARASRASSTPTAASPTTTRSHAGARHLRAGGLPDGVDARGRVDRGTGAAARTPTASAFPAGGKTGTTDDFKDAWFVGFTSAVVVGVWVGFDQPATIGREGYGARFALPIWSEFMQGRGAQARRARVRCRRRACGKCSCARCRTCKPVEGCPTYTEYFKEGRRRPDAAVPDPPGHGEAADPARGEGFFSAGEGSSGRKLDKGLFKCAATRARRSARSRARSRPGERAHLLEASPSSCRRGTS